MILIYRPEGGDEQRFDFDLSRCRVKEREAVEKRTEMAWGAFKAGLAEENTTALRGLLWMMLRRVHPTYRWDDVDFSDEELTVVITAADYRRTRAEVEASTQLSQADKDEALAELDRRIADREEIEAVDPEQAGEGKAQPPSGDTPTP